MSPRSLPDSQQGLALSDRIVQPGRLDGDLLTPRDDVAKQGALRIGHQSQVDASEFEPKLQPTIPTRPREPDPFAG